MQELMAQAAAIAHQHFWLQIWPKAHQIPTQEYVVPKSIPIAGPSLAIFADFTEILESSREFVNRNRQH